MNETYLTWIRLTVRFPPHRPWWGLGFVVRTRIERVVKYTTWADAREMSQVINLNFPDCQVRIDDIGQEQP